MKLKIFKKISVLVLILFWVFSGWPVFQVQSVSASTSYYDPISDISTGWDCTGTDCDTLGHYSVLNDGVREPNVPDTSDYISQLSNNKATDEHSISSVSEGNINYITLWAYVSTGSDHEMNISFQNNDSEVASITVSPGTTESWVSANWNSPSSIGTLTAEFTSTKNGGGQPTDGYVYAWYVEVDYTTPVISISLDPTEFDYGFMDLSEEKRATSIDPPGATGITVTNTGDVDVDLEIKGGDAVGGTQTWTLSDVIGTDQYVHEFSTDLTDFTNPASLTSTYQSLANNIAPSGTQAFDLNIKIPSSVTEKGVEISAPVTIRATEAGI